MDKREIITRFKERLALDAHISNAKMLVKSILRKQRSPKMDDALNKLIRITTGPSILKTEEHPEVIIKRFDEELKAVGQSVNRLDELVKKEKKLLKKLNSLLAKSEKLLKGVATVDDFKPVDVLSADILGFGILPLKSQLQFLKTTLKSVETHTNNLVAITNVYNLSQEQKLVNLFNSIKENNEKLKSKLEDIEKIDISQKAESLTEVLKILKNASSEMRRNEQKVKSYLRLAVEDIPYVVREKNNEIRIINEVIEIYSSLSRDIKKCGNVLMARIPRI